jgi:hypothetical protein
MLRTFKQSKVEFKSDLRDRLDRTRRVRDTLGKRPDLRETLDRSRREKEERVEKEKEKEKEKVSRVVITESEGKNEALYHGPDTAETGGDCLPGFYCRCCEPNKHFWFRKTGWPTNKN